MKQFGRIFQFELKNYLKNKVFVGITLFLVVVIVAVMFFPRITSGSEEGPEQLPTMDGSGNQSEQTEQLPDVAEGDVMLVKAETPEQAEIVREAFQASFPDYQVQTTELSVEEIRQQVTSQEAECAFVMTSPTSYTYYVNTLSLYDSNCAVADDALRRAYQVSAMMENGISAQQAGEIMDVQIESTTESLGQDQTQNFFYTYIMIMALYLVILLYGQMVATNVATEKSSRAMELLITSANPTSMMFGKVLASCLAGFIQLVAVFGTAVLCFNLNKSYWDGNLVINSIFNMPLSLLGYMLVYFVLGFLVYAFLYGAIGSTVSKLEDINTSVMPITMLFVVAFMVVIFSMSSGNVDNMLMKVCSFVPFTSPMAMFTRIAMSTVPGYQIGISIGILILSAVFVGYVSAKIYRVGVLLYGTKPKLSEILKNLKKA